MCAMELLSRMRVQRSSLGRFGAGDWGTGVLFTPQRLTPQLQPRALLGRGVFCLDRWLQERNGVFEYSRDNRCIFRIQRARVLERADLAGGSSIGPSEPILNLHLWNEHIPAIRDEGATLGWARRLSRAIDFSLKELARYLSEHPELDEIVAMRASMRLGREEKNRQLAYLSARYGFEDVVTRHRAASRPLHRLGENVLVLLLVLATNPMALRVSVLLRTQKVVYLPRAALHRRYGPPASQRQ
jgi:hypothetical protein